MEFEIKNTIPFTLASPKMKYLGIQYKSNKICIDLYEEKTHKTLMNKIKEEPSKWGDMPCSWIGRLNVKVLVLPNLIYRFSATPIKIPAGYFMDMNQLILKFI